MSSIKVNPIIKENGVWEIKSSGKSLQELKDTYLHCSVTDGVNTIRVSEINFIMPKDESLNYTIELIDSNAEYVIP